MIEMSAGLQQKPPPPPPIDHVIGSRTSMLYGRNGPIVLCGTPMRTGAKRLLFEPYDGVATQKFVDDELSKQLVSFGERWNFDVVNETMLDPDGEYVWRQATPQKRTAPRRPNLEEYDTSSYYFEPIEAGFDDVDTTQHTYAKQTLITDYMVSKKRGTGNDTKKVLQFAGRPAKMPKLNDCAKS